MVESTDIKESQTSLMKATSQSLRMRKGERLHHRNAVEALFNRGKSEYAYPLRMFYLFVEEGGVSELLSPAAHSDVERLQMMVTVPKKKFKHAVDRVWLRRRIREAYRLNRLSLKDALSVDVRGRYLMLAFIYVGNEKVQFCTIEKKMLKLFDKLKAVMTTLSEDSVSGKTISERDL